MKTKLTLIAVLMSLGTMLSAQNILTLDVGEVYDNYYKAKEATTKFGSDFESAQEEMRLMVEEGRKLADQLQEAMAKANNPALSEDARRRSGGEAEELSDGLRRKETELTNFRQQTEQSLAARRQSIFEFHLDEIKDAVSEVARSRGADYVLNTNGLGVLYATDAADITQEVLSILNASAPPAVR